MKKWKCTVCGYVHEGAEPPENCPVCGVGKELFEELIEKEIPAQKASSVQDKGAEEGGAPTDEGGDTQKPSKLIGLLLDFHIHPIAVHTPNGVLPLAFLFLLIGSLFGLADVEKAAFFCLCFVLLSLPLVVATGYLEWQHRYKGAVTNIFKIKIAASVIIFLSLLGLVVWRLVDSGVAHADMRWGYIALFFLAVLAVGIAGHLGGKLVFETRDR